MRSLRLRECECNGLLSGHIGFLIVPVLALILSGCASPDRTDVASANPQQALQVLAQRHQVCGVAVAVVKHRRLDSLEFASGCPPAPAPGPDSVFQAASLSKPVFAYAVLKLVAQGKLELDAPIVKYLPQGYRHQLDPMEAEPTEWVPAPRLAAVTVRMALNHTSGLPNWASGPLKLQSPPGARWEYSGEGYVLLQRAVEAVAGQPLDQFMRSQVFEPLAMDHSGYVWTHAIAQHLLPGTKANGTPRKTVKLENPSAAFSLYTTAADYGKFLVHVLNDDMAMEQIVAAPVAADPGLGLGWGLGWGIEGDPDGPAIWQWGNNRGYRAFVIASVREGDGFVMLTNSENGLRLAEPLTRQLLPGEHTLFKSSILGTDIVNIVCNTVRLCL